MAGLALALACGFAAAASAPAPNDELRAQALDALHKNLAPAFVLDKALRLDPELRAAADKLAAEHLARIDKLLPAWLDEERKLQSAGGKTPSSFTVFYAVLARIDNELALWQIEPGDANYEHATLAVLRTSPRVCEMTGDYRFTDFASRILRIQAMPEKQRAAALATERQLLAHWGQPRAALAPWPDPLPQDAALALLRRGPADAEHRTRLALTPKLAAVVFGSAKDYPSMHPVERCVLQQWWLQESLHEGATPAAVLNAYRYGTMITTVDRMPEAYGKADASSKIDPASPPPYPALAKRFVATGKTTVHVQVDADGKPRQASVTDRRIDVQGIRGVRPVAFENAFDAMSVRYALEGRRYDKPAGDTPATLRLVWTLDDAPKPATATDGAKQ